MPQPRINLLLVFILAIAVTYPVSAQTSVSGPTGQERSDHEHITTAQGLSQGLINDMIQDQDGFIWIATKGGLNRYDGYSFKTFTNDPQDSRSISSNFVSNLLEDRRGRLWVGTHDAGISVYDKISGRFTRITHSPGDLAGLSSNRIISAMLEMPDGRILVAPQGGRIQMIALPGNDSFPPVITSVNAPGDREVLGLARDDKGFIWAGCTDNSVFIYRPASSSFELLSDGKTFTSLISKTGTRLNARGSQVFMLVPIPARNIKFLDSAARFEQGAITKTADGYLLIDGRIRVGTGSAGSIFYDFSTAMAGSPLRPSDGSILQTKAGGETIKSMLLDRSGILWVGTMGHGIYKYRIDNNAFHALLPGLSVQKVNVLDKDLIYVQGWNSVMTINAAGMEITNPLERIFKNFPATNVLHAKNGEYWTYNLVLKKLCRYAADLSLRKVYDQPVNPSSTEQLQPLIEDSRGRIWLGAANGSLAMVDAASGELTRYTIKAEQGLATPALVQTNVFYEDGKGTFWLGTEHGFARLIFADKGAEPDLTWYKNKPGDSNSLNYNYVSWFMDDPSDSDLLWISTKGGGLNCLDKSTGKFTHYTSKQGLPNDVIYGTLADKAGNIWGSTNRGLFCIMAGSAKRGNQPVFRLFSTSDGLQADEFNTNAFAKLPNGNLVFAGVNGVNIFNPEQVLARSFKPNVFITGIQIGNKELLPRDASGILQQTIEKSRAITLSHEQDVLTLEFSSLDFTVPHQNKYRYQLIGIDKEWVESGTRRTATYLHLPAGNYTFKVQGSNSQGIWNDKPTELGIVVLPPWWRTWWAYLIYASITALAIRAYLKFNVKKAKLESQLNYEQREAKRIKELDSVKTRLYTNITHEFRTPVTVIMGMAQQVIENPSEQFESRMQMIVRNGRNLLNLVNEMLDLSKLETGKMELQLSQGDVIHFLRYVVESFHSLAATQQKQLHFLTDNDVLYMEYDKEKLRQIVFNLLSNAIKFTPEHGNVYISVVVNPDKPGTSLEHTAPGSVKSETATLVIKVKDTGIGIPEDKIHHIFDRFYQLDNSHTRSAGGTGIGLALTKELVKLMNGEISVKSPPAGISSGAEFMVSLSFRMVDPVMENIGEDWKKSPAKILTPAVHSDLPLLQVPGAPKNSNAPLILLVEDNADVVAYTASCLPEYRLAVGKDGREGLEIAIDMIPDLIITDVMMPFMDGFELVEKLRENEFTSHIPVIMLTAKADLVSKIEGLQRGAEAYLEKPFIKEELLVRIQQLLDLRKKLQLYYLAKVGLDNTGTDSVSTDIHKPVNGLPAAALSSGQPSGILSGNVDKPEDPFVANVRELIEQNMTDANFTVERLCKMVFMSHSQFHRKLEALTGCAPNKFIRMLRLKRALGLLPDTSKSIGSIALDCGYNDPGYFARVFRQEYDMTPQEWRASKA